MSFVRCAKTGPTAVQPRAFGQPLRRKLIDTTALAEGGRRPGQEFRSLNPWLHGACLVERVASGRGGFGLADGHPLLVLLGDAVAHPPGVDTVVVLEVSCKGKPHVVDVCHAARLQVIWAARASAGSTIAANIPTIATTTNNSTIVNARLIVFSPMKSLSILRHRCRLGTDILL